jgi:Domain of unknown function (DUF5615)
VKVLFDENMPVRLRRSLPGHEVSTVRYLGWLGVENGDLLALAQQHGFEAMVSQDQSLPYQNHLPKCSLRVVLLSYPARELATVMLRVAALLNDMQPGEVRRLSPLMDVP